MYTFVVFTYFISKQINMKRGKVVSMPNSTEAQIRTRARNLPVDRCYVNDNWEDAQIANVVVTRKHTNGNISFVFIWLTYCCLV